MSAAPASQMQKVSLPKTVLFRAGRVTKEIRNVDMGDSSCQSTNHYVCASNNGRRQVARDVCNASLSDAREALTCLRLYLTASHMEQGDHPNDNTWISFEDVRPDVCLRLPEKTCKEAGENSSEPWCAWDNSQRRCGAPIRYRQMDSTEWKTAATFFGDSFNSQILPDLALWQSSQQAEL